MYLKKTILMLTLGILPLNATTALSQSPPTLPDIDISRSENGVVPMPGDVDPAYKFFDRYTKVVAPNGKPIHIVAEKGYTDRQVVYSRKVLENHLTDVPGTKYGSDKSAIANAMADNNAVLTLYYSTETMRSGGARTFQRARVPSQDLREYETILEGTSYYMDQDDPRRDASYEEILHFIQDYGINAAYPELSEKLWDAYRGALKKGIYTLEDTETNEYFICGLEAYYDMWKHDPTGDGTREGEYVPISRETLKEKDPAMYEIIDEFFGSTWLYTADIASEFDGTFSLTYDNGKTYTNKSQHLLNARLTGSNNSHLIGNGYDNILTGNEGDNEITPGKGIDVVDGGSGMDTALFPGQSEEYSIAQQFGYIIVANEPEGENRLTNVERIKFDDKIINASDVKPAPTLPNISISKSRYGVADIPEDVDPAFKMFSKYTKLIAPNGKPIHIVAASGVSDEKIAYARNILENHLTDVPGSLYGSDKSEIANTMANRNAMLSLSSREGPRDESAMRAFYESGIISQGLGDFEMITEGSPEYIDQDNPRRDASYEEILHFVHDQGIIPSNHPMQKALYRALDKALESKTYMPDEGLPSGSYTQEYLVMGMEAFFGLWAHDPGGDGYASGGEYKYINREYFKKGDPLLYEIVNGFLPSNWAYTAQISEKFDGTFSMTFDGSQTYTFKSQYLNKAQLNGSNNTSLIGNDRDNVLAGNRGNNVLNGGEGNDTAVFSGNQSDYRVEKRGSKVIVVDTVENRDGRNTLENIENIQFRDATVRVSDL